MGRQTTGDTENGLYTQLLYTLEEEFADEDFRHGGTFDASCFKFEVMKKESVC